MLPYHVRPRYDNSNPQPPSWICCCFYWLYCEPCGSRQVRMWRVHNVECCAMLQCVTNDGKDNRLEWKFKFYNNPKYPMHLAWISLDYFESLLLPQWCLIRPAVNAVQWRHYSLIFALIHAKSKTRFSNGKPRNIVWKCLHDTELLYFFRS